MDWGGRKAGRKEGKGKEGGVVMEGERLNGE